MIGATLYHFTCQHGYDAIGEEGYLKPPYLFARQVPHVAEIPTFRFVWLTDLTLPIRHALGLTMMLGGCDRTAYRYRVTDNSEVQPWTQVRRTVSSVWRQALEEAVGARPSHWYVAVVPVPAVLDQRT